MNSPLATRTHGEMKLVLMDPNATGPAIHYYMIRGGAQKSNVTVWEPGTIGGEYIKAFGHYHVDELKESYTILAGEGILLIQTRANDEEGNPIDDKIIEFKALRVKAGDTIEIPPQSGHTLVNIGKTWLVTSDDSPWSEVEDSGAPRHADYEPMRKMRGFAYYVVENSGEPTLVVNPLYNSAPAATIETLTS